jgi:hypothetical protein
MIDPNTPPHIVTALAALTGAFIGSVGNGIAQLIAQWRKNVAERDLARYKFRHERKQAVFKRRFELAESWLSDAYRFREMMAYVRNGAAFHDEGKSRDPQGGGAESISRTKDTYFVPVERIQSRNEFIAAFMTKKHECLALFGSASRESFEKFEEAIRHIHTASLTLIGMLQPDGHFSDKDLGQNLLADIWAGYGRAFNRDDRIEAMINRAVEVAESLCRPVLEWVDEP